MDDEGFHEELPLPVSDELGQLLLFAMEYAVGVRLGIADDLVPGVVTEVGSERAIRHFVHDDLREGVEMARQFVTAGRDDAGREFERAALFSDAWVDVEGNRREAVLVEVHERGTASGMLLGQSYRSRRFRKPESFGNPFVLDEVAPLIGDSTS